MELDAAVPVLTASPDLAIRLGFAAAIGLLLGVDRDLRRAAGAFIGIIGAGLVVFNKSKPHNITIAAPLFLTEVIGIACGAAQWPLVSVAAPTGLIMLSVLRLAKPKDNTAPAPGADDATQA